MINVKSLFKSERGTHKGKVKVTRGGKTFYREQMVGRKEIEKKDIPKEIDLKDTSTRIKYTKNKNGLFLTVGGKRVNIPHKDMELFRETVRGLMIYDSSPKINFKDFKIKIEHGSKFISKITIWKGKKSYVGSILDITLSSL